MTKDVLVQYSNLVEEVKDLRKRIQKLSDQINKLEQDGCVRDCVKGGYGGIQTFKIEGFPYPEYSRKKSLLHLYKAQLENAELELLELTNKVEECIQSIDNSRIRRIIRYVFIDGLTYIQAAHRMGGRATADSIRMELNRFLEKK